MSASARTWPRSSRRASGRPGRRGSGAPQPSGSPGPAARGDAPRARCRGWAGEEPQQLAAGIAGGAGDGCPDHGSSIRIRAYSRSGAPPQIDRGYRRNSAELSRLPVQLVRRGGWLRSARPPRRGRPRGRPRSRPRPACGRARGSAGRRPATSCPPAPAGPRTRRTAAPTPAGRRRPAARAACTSATGTARSTTTARSSLACGWVPTAGATRTLGRDGDQRVEVEPHGRRPVGQARRTRSRAGAARRRSRSTAPSRDSRAQRPGWKTGSSPDETSSSTPQVSATIAGDLDRVGPGGRPGRAPPALRLAVAGQHGRDMGRLVRQEVVEAAPLRVARTTVHRRPDRRLRGDVAEEDRCPARTAPGRSRRDRRCGGRRRAGPAAASRAGRAAPPTAGSPAAACGGGRRPPAGAGHRARPDRRTGRSAPRPGRGPPAPCPTRRRSRCSRVSPRPRGAAGRVDGQQVVPVQADDLLDQVDRVGEVGTPGGRRHPQRRRHRRRPRRSRSPAAARRRSRRRSSCRRRRPARSTGSSITWTGWPASTAVMPT